MVTKCARYDPLLGMEALTFDGLSQPFPAHFHDYYVVGLMDGGTRRLTCQGQVLTVREGELLLFNPGDSHGCLQEGTAPLCYRSLHIPPERMAEADGGVLPMLRSAVRRPELFDAVSLLHRMICAGSRGRLEQWRETAGRLLEECKIGELPAEAAEMGTAVGIACRYFAANLHRRITLEEVCRHAGVSRSSLLRAFAAEKGISPYRYLEALRIGEAGRLLRQGVSPAEAALSTGFSDQSHFTNLFRALMGCSPGVYAVDSCGGEWNRKGEDLL